MREPTEEQIAVAIAAAERESRAWKIETLNGKTTISDVGRMLLPGALPHPVTHRTYDSVEKARVIVKYHVWRAGIKAAINV